MDNNIPQNPITAALSTAQPVSQADESSPYSAPPLGNPFPPGVNADITDDTEDLLNPPPVLAPEALHNVLREVCRVATRDSEASPVAVAANFLATFAALIGRRAFQHIGDGFCHARPYFLLVGRTGKARKGTSEYTILRLFAAVEKILSVRVASSGTPYTAMQRHEGGMSTGEGLGWAIRDDILDDEDKILEPGTADKRLLVVEAEFAGAMASASREKNNLSATIRTAWDGRTISPMVKNSKWAATNPHIVIVGHITAAELIARMTDTDAMSGFMNRFVILHIVRPKLVPLPKRTPDEDIQRIAAKIADAVLFATTGDFTNNNGFEIMLSIEAIKLWCAEYPELTREQDGIAGALLVRTEIYCRMLAMIFALLDKSAMIEPAHIKAALAWINYWKDSVRYIFQTIAARAEAEKLNSTAQDVLDFISKHPGCSRTDITKHFRNKLSSAETTAALNHLMNAAPPLIRQQTLPRQDGKPGKGSIVFRTVSKPLSRAL